MATYQTASDSTFDEDSTSGSPSTSGLVLVPVYDGSTLSVTTADTDQQTVRLQYEQGGVGSGSWRTLKEWVNVNITAYTFANKNYARVRIVAVADAGGASTASITEDVQQIDAIYGKDGKPVFTIDSFDKDRLTSNSGQSVAPTSGKPIGVTETASFTASKEKHAGKVTKLDGSGGALTITLPSSTGSLDEYTFVSVVDPGSNDIVISCDADGGAFLGAIHVMTDASAPTPFASDQSGHDLITLSNTTTGGLGVGDTITVKDVGTDLWLVWGQVVSSGSEATPFSGT